MIRLKVGSTWRGNAHDTKFIIQQIEKADTGVWIHYTGSNGNNYNCLIGAFLERFREIPS